MWFSWVHPSRYWVWLVRFGLAAALLLATVLLHQFPSSFVKLDALVSDFMSRQQVVYDTPDLITIVDVDDASLQTIHSWPWPRSLLAQLLEVVAEEHDAAAVLLDVLLPEDKPGSGDEALAAAVAKGRVCLSQAFDLVAQPKPRQLGLLNLGSVPAEGAFEAVGFVANFAGLASVAQCVGHITPLVDGDGLVRHMPLQIAYGDQAWWSLAHSALLGSGVDWRGSQTGGKLKIPFRTAPEAWRVISARDVLLGEVAPGSLDGHYVLIGASALGLSDRISTPIHPWLPGYVVHAEQLAFGLYPPDAGLGFKPSALWFALFGVGLVFWLVVRFHPWILVLGLLGYSALWLFLVDRVWYVYADLWVSLPLLAMGLSLLVLLPFEWWVARRLAGNITRVFKDYVTPDIVDELVAQSGDYVSPRVQVVTVMFADIEGFTRLAKRYSTEELAGLTQALLTMMSEAVLAQRGTVDKYLGDAVMAFWNAPIEVADHAQRALEAAREIQLKLAEFNQQRGGEPIGVRIGIHSGEAMVGDLGTRFRHAYTAIGDSVNIAHRLQAAARNFDRWIVVSDASYDLLADQAGEDFVVVKPGDLRV